MFLSPLDAICKLSLLMELVSLRSSYASGFVLAATLVFVPVILAEAGLSFESLHFIQAAKNVISYIQFFANALTQQQLSRCKKYRCTLGLLCWTSIRNHSHYNDNIHNQNQLV